MSSGSQDVTQTSKVQLTPDQQHLLDLGMPSAEQFAKTHLKYPKNAVQPFDAEQRAGQAGALASADRQDQIGGEAKNAYDFLTSGKLMDVGANPYFSSAASAAAHPLEDNLTQNILPGIRNTSTMTGNFGSSRQGIAEGLAAGQTQRNIGDMTSKMAMDTYNSGLNAYQQGLQMTPMVQAAQSAGSLTRSGVGDVRQAQAQAVRNNNINRWNFDQMAPFMKASDILSLVNGTPGATTVNTGQGPSASPFSSALGGATLGSTIGSLFPGVGTGIGAGIGAAGGLLSSFYG